MTNKQTAQDKIESLVTRFEEQYQSYKHSDYNETLTRRDFIDPFFKALGWDMDNEAGYAEAYREVIHEDKVKVSGATKAPDYSFRLVGGKRLFFVEAKKPNVSVKEDIQPAYQVRRYGWSAKHPISIITDFEEFAIYDCTKKPNLDDKPSVARIKYLSFRDYLNEFDFIWETFSKEQILKGSFDKFLLSDTHKKGTATVDKDFLESLDRWRTYLAVNISWNNKNLDEDEINFIVQQTIDRIIFLRIAEDRSIEPYGTLKHAVKQGDLYQNIFELFNKADQKYNSGLFDFKKDKISQNVVIENKVIRTIINELYYPECPFEFSVLPVEILGSAYEQFLGKVIRITPAHHAKIEEKPEVRKAGGVYYTPQYIVDYIVKNTVGKLIEEKTPKEISKIKILDLACGSGSFLIGAFQYLLDYHKDYYSKNGKPSKGKKDNPLTPNGHLTTAEKKRILLNNIFGVDLDTNAVEVTKLSLLLKCLEGETEASIKQQLSIWNERVLPTLENNIKCGNSLIDIDFYSGNLDLALERSVKPFNWKNEFHEIISNGGFDSIIGNPPYIQSREGQLASNEKDYYYKIYKTSEYQINTFGLFIEKGLGLLKTTGILGLIIPNYWLSTKYDSKLRTFLFKENHVIELLNVYKVFEAAIVDTLIVLAEKNKKSGKKLTLLKSIDRKLKNIQDRLLAIKENKWSYDSLIDTSKDEFVLSFQETSELKSDKKISDYFVLKFGAKLYEVGKGIPPQNKEDSANHIYESEIKVDNSYLKLLRARHIKRYFIDWHPTYIKYGKNLAAPRDPSIFTGDRILVQRIVSKDSLDSVYITENIICNTDIITLKPKSEINCKFFLAILNSNLIGRYIKSINVNLDREAFPKINTNTLEELPVPDPNSVEKKTLSEIEDLVDQILQLNILIHKTNLESKITQYKNKLLYCDQRLEEIICNIYKM
jgi:type I restriction-modification system DNA methylase subunit